MIIYVSIDFQQHPDDTIICSNADLAKLETSKASRYEKWRIQDEETIANFEKYIHSQTFTTVESIIYQHYPEKKQNQDQVAVTAYKTKLSAYGVNNIESLVVGAATKVILAEASLSEVVTETINLAAVSQDISEMVEKLIRVAIRVDWVERVIKEGRLSLAENRVADYPEYPAL